MGSGKRGCRRGGLPPPNMRRLPGPRENIPRTVTSVEGYSDFFLKARRIPHGGGALAVFVAGFFRTRRPDLCPWPGRFFVPGAGGSRPRRHLLTKEGKQNEEDACTAPGVLHAPGPWRPAAAAARKPRPPPPTPRPRRLRPPRLRPPRPRLPKPPPRKPLPPTPPRWRSPLWRTSPRGYQRHPRP